VDALVIIFNALDEQRHRKSAKCQVWMLPGTGQVYVDGVHMSDRFPAPHLLQVVMQPFDQSRTWGRYNVWALTQGGGVSGKAGALAVAMARSLAIHEPGCEEGLKNAGLLDIDRRQSERKKTGQPKARKKKSWVKR
jgi:small subunit ribosomal protein S9